MCNIETKAIKPQSPEPCYVFYVADLSFALTDEIF